MNISSRLLDAPDIYFLMFNFSLYSFLGWVIEGLFSLLCGGRFSKPGFLLGPFKPMYGFAMTALIVIKAYTSSFPFMLLMSFIIPTSIEYISALLLDKFFYLKYWDYSCNALNLNGYICPAFSVTWIVLTLLAVYKLQPYISLAYTAFNSLLKPSGIVFSIYIMIDFIVTVITKSPYIHLT